MHHIPHSTYYRDRASEYELCNDFPGDEILIDGLHAMQMHFWKNNVAVDIPVVRLMNTVHYIAAYMFVTECSGDQMEYDVLAYDSLSRDKQLVPLTMIVLAAMLKRTEGFRARQCRNVILDNRDPDFEEGVLLYDKFLRSAQAHFEEENFLIDVNTLVTRVQEQDKQITQLTSENIQLKYTITTMEEKYQQINIGTQNNNCTINNYFGYDPTSASMPTDEPKQETSSIPPDFFCISSRFSEENIRERLAAELAQATSKIDYCRSLYRLQHMGCINIQKYASDAQRAIVFNRFQSKFNLSPDDFCRARKNE